MIFAAVRCEPTDVFNSTKIQRETASNLSVARANGQRNGPARVRNSNDESFLIGFCVGNRTLVCDNFALSSEVVIAKRHTDFGNDRFQEGVAAAIERLNEYRELETQRILTLQATALPDATAESVDEPFSRNVSFRDLVWSTLLLRPASPTGPNHLRQISVPQERPLTECPLFPV